MAAPVTPLSEHGWICRTISAIAAAEPMQRPTEHLAAWNLLATHHRPRPESRFRSGLHAHRTLELCIAVHGQGVLDIGDRRYRLTAPALVTIGPDVMHSEGYYQHRIGYGTMWVCLRREGRLGVHANQYLPGEGWSSPLSTPLSRQASHRLERWFNSGVVPQPAAFEHLRVTLLAALGELARQVYELAADTDAGRAGEDRIGAGHRRVLRWVRAYLDSHYPQPLTLAQVAAMTRYTPNYLDTLFSRWTGSGIRAYVIERRMTQAMHLLRASDVPVKQVAGQVGYDDPLYFSRAFRRYFGICPSEARQADDGADARQ